MRRVIPALLCTGFVLLAAYAAPLQAASPVPAALQQRFVRLDTPFAKAAAAFTTAAEKISAAASNAQFDAAIAAPASAYAAALASFDSGLTALRLPGRAGSDAASIVKDNTQLRSVLESAAHGTKTAFVSGFGKVAGAEGTLQETFRVDLGLPATAAIVI